MHSKERHSWRLLNDKKDSNVSAKPKDAWSAPRCSLERVVIWRLAPQAVCSTCPTADAMPSSAVRATMLLANNDPSDQHRAFVAEKARELTAAVLKVFWPSAKGSLHHGCCVLDYLLRFFADEVRDRTGMEHSE